jgi:hypothetical protein
VFLIVGSGAIVAFNLAGSALAPRPVPTGAPVVASSVQAAEVSAASQPSTAIAVRVANTDGVGAFLRRTPNLNDRLRAWPDNTLLRIVGPDTTAEGIEWKQVEDPAGNRGWIPAQYTKPEPNS